VQHGQQQDRDRAGEVQHGAGLLQDGGRVADVAVQVGARLGAGPGGQQGAAVGQDQRVVVGIHHPAGGADLLRDLVGGSGCGQPGADVEELADPQARGGVPGDPLPEGPVRPRRGDYFGPRPGDLAGYLPVGRVMVFPAQPARVHPGRVRHPRIELRGRAHAAWVLWRRAGVGGVGGVQG
jgi:hypothetical protein